MLSIGIFVISVTTETYIFHSFVLFLIPYLYLLDFLTTTRFVSMKKICINEKAPAPFVEIVTEKLSASGFDILVEVKSGSFNPVDLKVRGGYAGNTPKVLGYDGAGVVAEIGEMVNDFVVGDSVYYAGDLSRDGAYASHQIVDSRIMAKMPTVLSFEDAAALPLTALTAYESLFDRMGIDTNSDASVLIINGAGGVGSIAIQLLLAKTNCTIIATASRSESKLWCQKMGANFVIDHSKPLKDQLDAIGIGEVRYILNCADSTDHLLNLAECIAAQGKINCLVDFREPVDMNLFKRKSITFCWEFMFTRPLFKTEDLTRQKEILAELADLVDNGKIITTKTGSVGTLSVESIAEGHRRIAEGKTIGKLTWTI